MAINPNLLKNSDFRRDLKNWSNNGIVDANRAVVDNTEVPGFSKAVQIAITGTSKGVYQYTATLPAGTYTLSGWLKSTVADKDYIELSLTDLVTGTKAYPKTNRATTTWSRVSATYTLANESQASFFVGRGGGDMTATTLLATGLKLEKSDTMTDWVPGTEDNLFRNAGFLDGMTRWSLHTAANVTVTQREVVDEVLSPSSKAVAIKANGLAGIWQAFGYVPAILGRTYTLSFMAKGTGSTEYGWEGLTMTRALTSTYQLVSYTFTYSVERNYSFYLNAAGGEMWIHSMKLEEGPYATAWTAAPADINMGKDRPVIATGQYTIIDYNDQVSLVSSISSNLPMSQQYSSADERFNPDWTSTNLVLTASLYKGADTTDIIGVGDVTSIKWYRLSAIDGTVPVLITNNASYSILGNKLTVTQNILNDKDSIDFICEITYRDPVFKQDLITKSTVTFSRVRDGGVLTRAIASLPKGNSMQNSKAVAYKKNDSYVGRNLVRYTDYITGGGEKWVHAGTGLSMTKTVVNEPTAPTGKALDVTFTAVGTSNGGPYKSLVSKPIAGRTYSWSVWIKGSKNQTLSIGQEQGGQKTVSITTEWQKFTNTYVATDTPYAAFVFYSQTVPAVGDKLLIHSMKVEEGPNLTEWSMAPEDIPVLDVALGSNNWALKKYVSTKNGTYLPMYEDILGKPAYVTQSATDATNLFTEKDETTTPYIGHLQTAVYSPVKRDIPLSFNNGGPLTIHVNNETEYFGGINLVPNSDVVKTGASVQRYDFDAAKLIPYIGKEITISFDAKAEEDGVHVVDWYLRNNTISASITNSPKVTLSGTYSRITQTLVVPEAVRTVTDLGIGVRGNAAIDSSNVGSFSIKNMKVEIGHRATAWSAAPEDGRNLLIEGARERWSSREYVNIPITDIAKTYMGQDITISFDLKAAIVGDVRVYSLGRYTIGTNTVVAATTEYQRFKVTGRFAYGATVDPNGENCNLSFYGTYDTGRIPYVKNVKVELGNKATVPAFSLADEEVTKNAVLPVEQGWNTVDVLWLANARTKTGIWNVEAGGRNVVRYSNIFKNTLGGALGVTPSFTPEGYVQVVSAANNQNWFTGWMYDYTGIENSFVDGEDFTISFEMKSPDHNKVPSIYFKTGMGYFWMKGTMSTEFSQVSYSGKWQKANGLNFHIGFSGIVGTTIIKNVKIEKGTYATPWTINSNDAGGAYANLMSKTMEKLNSYHSISFEDQTENLIAKCQLQRGSVIDTTNVAHQWYKQDASVKTDQGGGIGWLKLIASSIEKGYDTDTLIIPPEAVSAVEYYKCIIRDTQIDSATYNGYFSSTVSVSNVEMPIEVKVETNGTVILNGQANKTLKAKLYQMGREIDPRGDEYTYKWYRFLSTGTKDTAWAGGIGFKVGKTLVITSADVSEKATFSIEIE